LRRPEPVGLSGGEGDQLEAGGLAAGKIRIARAKLQLDPDRRPGRVRKPAVPHRCGVLRRPASQRAALARGLGGDRDRPDAGRGEQLQPERADQEAAAGDGEHVLIGYALALGHS
jgi:hypothetical protein